MKATRHRKTRKAAIGTKPVSTDRVSDPSKSANRFSGSATLNRPRNVLLTGLGPDFARLRPSCESVSLSAGQDIYQFGKPVEFVYFPETAVLGQIFFLEDGSSTGTAIIGKEGMAGLCAVLDTQWPAYWTQVIIPGLAVRIRVSAVKQELLNSSTTQRLLHRYTAMRIAQLSQQTVCNLRHKLDGRLCTLLLMINDRTSEKRLPLTHEQIAAHLGGRRAGVTSACNLLRQRKIIDYRRGHMSILSRSQLEAAACECYKALKQDLTGQPVGGNQDR